MRIGMWLVAGMVASCLPVSSAETNAGGTPLTTIRVASGLNRPLFVTHAPGDADRIYIVEKPGTIKVMDLGTGVVSVFLDITARVGTSRGHGGEQGLLGLAFHPDFASNKFFYVNYTNNSGDTRVSRFVAIDPDNGDDTSEFVILSISQPQSNHNGGWLAFGPNDGYLYVATGDGGNHDDQGFGHTSETGNGQDITNNLLGKILRIDVDGDSPYAIPPDNPFVGITGDDEIWAYGLRNPWRNAFDPSTGDLYIADVGQQRSEEISFQPASSTGGENYGWRCREGASDYIFTANCVGETFFDPIHEYSHGGSPFRCSITGGEVYHGCAIPDLIGTYFFADWCSDSIWSFRIVDGVVTEFQERTAELAPGSGLSIQDIASFGTDSDGEMYICDHGAGNGEVFRIVAAVGGDCNCNGIPDECDTDCGVPGGACDLPDCGQSVDCNRNGIPDECRQGDIDGDDSVSLVDHSDFTACMTGPCSDPPCVLPPDAPLCCAILDFDVNGSVDLHDAAAFQRSFDSPSGNHPRARPKSSPEDDSSQHHRPTSSGGRIAHRAGALNERKPSKRIKDRRSRGPR